jgi:hypothetical protein
MASADSTDVRDDLKGIKYLGKRNAAQHLGLTVQELEHRIARGKVPTLELFGVPDDSGPHSPFFLYYVRNTLIHALDSRQFPLKTLDVAVLLVLSFHANKDGLIWASQRRLALLIRAGVRSVRRSLAKLRKLGLIERVKHPRGPQNTETDTYRFGPAITTSGHIGHQNIHKSKVTRASAAAGISNPNSN